MGESAVIAMAASAVASIPSTVGLVVSRLLVESGRFRVRALARVLRLRWLEMLFVCAILACVACFVVGAVIRSADLYVAVVAGLALPWAFFDRRVDARGELLKSGATLPRPFLVIFGAVVDWISSWIERMSRRQTASVALQYHRRSAQLYAMACEISPSSEDRLRKIIDIALGAACEPTQKGHLFTLEDSLLSSDVDPVDRLHAVLLLLDDIGILEETWEIFTAPGS